jgi:predicted DNA-binding protein
MNDRRENRLRQLMDATGEKTKAKAIDLAVAHYLQDLENKRVIAESLSKDEVEALSTAQMPIERGETVVGRTKDGR